MGEQRGVPAARPVGGEGARLGRRGKRAQIHSRGESVAPRSRRADERRLGSGVGARQGDLQAGDEPRRERVALGGPIENQPAGRPPLLLAQFSHGPHGAGPKAQRQANMVRTTPTSRSTSRLPRLYSRHASSSGLKTGSRPSSPWSEVNRSASRTSSAS